MKGLKLDSDDQESVCSEKSGSCKSLSYDDSESSTCDSIITNFNHCSFNNVNMDKGILSPVNEEIEEIDEADFTNDSVNEISIVEISSLSISTQTIESAIMPVSNEKEKPKTKDSSTNTEKYRYRRKMFRQSNNRYFRYKPYGYRHFNYQPNNYYRRNYQRPFYNNYQQTQFNNMNSYQSHTFCNRWDCELRNRQNQHFKIMLLRGMFHFTKFLEFIAQAHC